MAHQIINDSIINVINDINSASSSSGDIILPALQREFVWKPKDIAKLFDSLMQDYPINTMLFWEINNLKKTSIEFYKFLSPNYTTGDTNVIIKVSNTQNKHRVVIDGQQRLTSLYIALRGSYKNTNSSKNPLPQELFLRLDKPNTSTDPEMKFDFQFLTDKQYKTKLKSGEIWFKTKDAIESTFSYSIWLRNNTLLLEDYALQTLEKLYSVLRDKTTLQYYNIRTTNSIDDVLDIFIRTNSGGYVLTKGALLLSKMASQWAIHTENARDFVEEIISNVKSKGYKIDKDWVLKCCSLLVGAPASVKVSNFSNKTCDDIFVKKDDIKKSINKAFELVKSFGLIEKGLSTKLAIIPLVCFLNKNNFWKTAITNSNKQATNWQEMRKFLFRAICKNLFEASTDTTLDKIKTIIDKAGKDFPYSDIETELPDLKISVSDYNEVLSTKKRDAFPVLNVIYALDGKTLNPLNSYDIDHIHPKKNFASSKTKNVECDTIANLQLMDSSANRSKNAKDLESWYNSMGAKEQKNWRDNNIIPQKASLVFADFRTFVSAREKIIKEILKSL